MKWKFNDSSFSSHRVDFNKDRSVSAKEMQRWIMEKTEEHFQEAMVENKNSFRAVDPDGDGEGQRGESHRTLDWSVALQHSVINESMFSV